MTLEFVSVVDVQATEAQKRARALLDVIECSWFENDGPVHLRPSSYVEPMVPVPTRDGRANGQDPSRRSRIVAALEDAGDDGMTCIEIADRVESAPAHVHNSLTELAKKGRVVKLGEQRNARWRAA